MPLQLVGPPSNPTPFTEQHSLLSLPLDIYIYIYKGVMGLAHYSSGLALSLSLSRKGEYDALGWVGFQGFGGLGPGLFP